MKKIAALSIAAFYLLLTTGMYVCILHCTADYFLSSHADEMHAMAEKGHNGKEAHEKKPCSKDEDCACCKKHGEYVVKENIQLPFGNSLNAIALLAVIPQSLLLTTPQREILSFTWPHSNAPPEGFKEPLYISYRSLLI